MMAQIQEFDEDLQKPGLLTHPEHLGAEALFCAHASFVASFMRRLGVQENDVEDLVQEVFLLAHKKGGYNRGPAHPRTWLGAIAVRLVQNRRRSLARRREESNEVAIELSVSRIQNPAEKVEAIESLRRVQNALNTLDVEHRATFILYELENESCVAIATAMDVPVGTVYSRLHHARRQFVSAYEHSNLGAVIGLGAWACAWSYMGGAL